MLLVLVQLHQKRYIMSAESLELWLLNNCHFLVPRHLASRWHRDLAYWWYQMSSHQDNQSAVLFLMKRNIKNIHWLFLFLFLPFCAALLWMPWQFRREVGLTDYDKKRNILISLRCSDHTNALASRIFDDYMPYKGWRKMQPVTSGCLFAVWKISSTNMKTIIKSIISNRKVITVGINIASGYFGGV